MNIAFFVTAFPTLSETFIVNQIIALQNSGHKVAIFSKERPANGKVHQMILDAKLLQRTFYLDEIPQTRIAKIGLLITKLVKRFSSKNIKRVIRAAFRNDSVLSVYELIHYLDKPEYEVLHAHFGLNGVYVSELKKLGLFVHSKFITTFHGFDLNPDYRQNKEYDYLFVHCDRFTVNTLYSRKLLIELGCDESKISVLPVGLGVTRFKKKIAHDENKKQLQLLFVGRLIELKGPMNFLKICKLLIERGRIDFRALVIGDGPLFSTLRTYIQEENLSEIVTLSGEKTQEDIRQYLDESDIFVFPGTEVNGLAEAQGLVIQEAQAMELPVLVSDAGGMADGILDSITGHVLPQGDVGAFVDKIEFIAENPALRIKMGKAGRKFVEENYDSKVLNEGLLKIYNN